MEVELKVLTEFKKTWRITRMLVNLNNTEISQYMTRRGKQSKTMCVVVHDKLGTLLVKQTYKELIALKKPTIIKGFYHEKRKGKTRG